MNCRYFPQNNSMLIRIITVVLIFAHSSIGSSQNNQPDVRSRPLRTDSSDITLQLFDGEIKSTTKVCSDCFFHWFKNGKVQITKAGYDGSLLHGLYTEMYKTGQLMMQGQFNKGLKKGEWREWYTNGELHRVSHYRNGKLDGKTELYTDRGEVLEVTNYKNNELNGKRICYLDSVCIKEKYHRGKLKSATRELKEENRISERSRSKCKRKQHLTKTADGEPLENEQGNISSEKRGNRPHAKENKARNSNE